MPQNWRTRLVAWLGVATASHLTAVETRITESITERIATMADQITETLNAVAERVGGELRDAVVALINEDKAKAVRLAELEGTEVTQSEAAARVKAAVDGLAADLTASPDAPDVEPLPEIPAEPSQPVDDGGAATPDETPDAGADTGAVAGDGEQQQS